MGSGLNCGCWCILRDKFGHLKMAWGPQHSGIRWSYPILYLSKCWNCHKGLVCILKRHMGRYQLILLYDCNFNGQFLLWNGFCDSGSDPDWTWRFSNNLVWLTEWGDQTWCVYSLPCFSDWVSKIYSDWQFKRWNSNIKFKQLSAETQLSWFRESQPRQLKSVGHKSPPKQLATLNNF